MSKGDSMELVKIRTNGGTQPREAIDSLVVAEYAEAMKAGAKFPAVVVFHDGTDYWLADGFHRVAAVMVNGGTEIDAEVMQGSQRDAKWYSFGANKTHGLRRQNGDARRAIEAILRDTEWATKSLETIAQHVGVSQPYVSQIKKQLITTYELPTRTITTGVDGRTRDTSNIGKPSPTVNRTEWEAKQQSDDEVEIEVYQEKEVPKQQGLLKRPDGMTSEEYQTGIHVAGWFTSIDRVWTGDARRAAWSVRKVGRVEVLSMARRQLKWLSEFVDELGR